MTINEYLDLVTSEHRDKQNFTGVVTLDVSVAVRVQQLLMSLIDKFDLDSATGKQLDIIGLWAGVTRNVSIPITGIFFSWDADYTLGWEYGSWEPPNAPTQISELPDDAYRTLIRARIAANNWIGTTDNAYKIWGGIFPTLTILIQDHQDMSYDLGIMGGIVDSLTLALLTGGYIPLKPEGIRINKYFIPVDSNKLFGWDVESPYVGGWDEASWAREITP